MTLTKTALQWHTCGFGGALSVLSRSWTEPSEKNYLVDFFLLAKPNILQFFSVSSWSDILWYQ